MFDKKSKHIDIKYHFIRREVELGTISVKYIASEDTLADIFTKTVSKVKLNKFILFVIRCYCICKQTSEQVGVLVMLLCYDHEC